MADTLIFQNKDLSKADQVAITLNDNGIPCYQKSKIGVMEFDELLPANPSAGIDVCYLVYVSETVEGQAREIVNTFPFADEHGPIPQIKKPMSPEFIRVINLIILAIAILFFVFMILK